MHHFTLLLALFTTTALAKYAYVVSKADAHCKDNYGGDVTYVKYDACTPFNSTYDTVLVNYGTGFEEMDSLSVFSDDNCKVWAGDNIVPDALIGTPAQCVSQSAHGGRWGSVQRTQAN